MLKKLLRMLTPRNLVRFPGDENGNILYAIWKAGDDLEAPRSVDFSLLFPSEEQAHAFARELSSRGEVEVSYFLEKQCWDLRFSPVMVPSWNNISEAEVSLGKAASNYEGSNDGWGFFSS